MQNFNNKKILLAPLDWGLGHTTRCISIIKLLLDKGNSVTVACNNRQKAILFKEFSEIDFLFLEGYNVSYSNHKFFLPFKLIGQLPKINNRIYQEHKWLDKIIKERNFEVVISDNRYGFYSKLVPSIFITHQLTIKAPFEWLEYLLQKINYSYINRFTQCWVPDYAGIKNIAGLLSHPKKLPAIPVHYIGPLARFKRNVQPLKDFKYAYCIILSGPEPQRTILENIIISQIHLISSNCLLIRGIPDDESDIIKNDSPFVTILNHLKGTDLHDAILNSEYIITRSGYTSVMELMSLQKKTILIPTPGQTEQEYIGEKLMNQKWALCIKQNDFNLGDDTKDALNFDYQLPSFDDNNLELVVTNFLQSIQ